MGPRADQVGPAPPPAYRNFVQGGLAAMCGSAASHPLDLLKVRLQVAEGGGPRAGPWSIARQVVAESGLRGLYRGLSASLLRQAAYSSTRFGVYDWAKGALGGGVSDAQLPLWAKVASGLAAGGVGAVVANPADVTLVRMQADGRLPAAQRRNYRNALHGVGSIVREEGVLALWKGASAASLRAMIVTASQFAAYDQFKHAMIELGMADGPLTHILGGFMAGVVASVTSTPVDVVKTRMQNCAPGQYRNPLDCALKTVRGEGPRALYKGFVPTLVRQAPYLVVMFVTLEQCKLLWRWLDEPPSKVKL